MRPDEGAIRRGQERISYVFEQAGVGIALVGPDGRWLWVNQTLCDIVGCGHDEMMGLTFRDITHPEDLDADLDQARQLLAGRITSYSTQKRFVRKDGSIACTKLTASLVRTPEGQPDYSIAVVEDISRRRLSEALFRTLAHSIPQLCWMADPDGHIVWYNRRWVEYTGATLEQLWGRRLLPVLDAEAQPRVLERWAGSVAGGEPFDMELMLRGRDGVSRPFLTRVEPVRGDDGRVAWWFGTHTDIGELKRAEAALRDSERIYRIVAENTYDFEFWSAPDGRYLYVSPSCERVSGYTPAEFLADPDLLQRLVHPEDRPQYEERTGALSADRSSVEFEFRIAHRDGTVRWLAQVCQPVFSERGEYLGVRGSNREVTDRKRTEEALKEADRRKGEFLAVLAHELRNPLAAIRSAMDLARGEGVAAADWDWGRGVIDRQSRLLCRLVDDLLDVSRIGRGKVVLRREPLDVRDVATRAVEVVRPLVEEKRQTLTVSLPPTPLPVNGDPVRLEQVLANLLTNAAKYTDEAGGITLAGACEGDEVVVRVRDTGIGIPAERLETVFGLFEQSDGSHDRAKGGLGIGLTLVRDLVELHGGRVLATSEGPGRGSEFTVRLPAHAGSAAQESRTTAGPRRAARRGRRVLVVDDNADNAAGLSRLLKRVGHDVRVADDGRSALVVARGHRPEVVLLDIGLPGMDGYEVLKRLRAEECCGGALIIAVSGYGQPEDLRRSGEAGFDRHLVKPVDYDALMELFDR